MNIGTKAFGLIEVDDHQRVNFPQGLVGFESYKNYVLLDADTPPFYWLQSLDTAELAFLVINPFLFRPDYEAHINNEELEDIGISIPEKALVLAVVTISANGNSVTANLQGPLIINQETHTGKQVVLSGPQWKTRHNILEELAALSC
ncbi:flagellar assembly factor FliW [Spirochaetia bacterium]|nr:flagellar assembly factor FliW [Spirochaetia bacterium]GHU37501.1 flagellar assembly factor FliW [Spirochaetia bacterium]